MKLSILKKMALPLITVAAFANNASAAYVDYYQVVDMTSTRYLTNMKYNSTTGWLSFDDEFKKNSSLIENRIYDFIFAEKLKETSFVYHGMEEYYGYGILTDSPNKDYVSSIINFDESNGRFCSVESECSSPKRIFGIIKAVASRSDNSYGIYIKEQVDSLKNAGFSSFRIFPRRIGYSNELGSYSYYADNLHATVALVNYLDLHFTLGSISAYVTKSDLNGKNRSSVTYTKADAVTEIDINSVDDNVTLVADFSRKFNNYGVYKIVQYYDGSDWKELSTPILYSDDADGSITTIVSSAMANTLAIHTSSFDGVKIRMGITEEESLDTLYSNVLTLNIVNPYTITYIDADGNELPSSIVYEGEVPNLPTLPVRDAGAVYKYFIAWTPEIVAASENATYTAFVDSIFVDNSIRLTASVAAGQQVMFKTPSPCVSASVWAVEGPSGFVMSDFSYEAGNQYLVLVNVSVDTRSTICKTDMLVHTLEKSGKAFIYVNSDKTAGYVNVSEGLLSTSNVDVDLVAGLPFGAVTIAADRSSATIDGTSDVAVADMDGIEVSGDVTLNRSYVAGKYSTVMLPFATSASNVPGVSFYGLHDVVKKDGEWQVQVSPVSEIQANTPYIVVASDDASNLVVTGGVTFNTTTGTKSSTAGDWQFVGTYEFRNWDEDHNAEEIGTTYGFASAEGDNDGVSIGTFGKVKAGAYIYPLRAYLRYVPVVTPKPASALAKSRTVASIDNLPESMDVVIVGGDSDEETTVIGTINTRTGEFRNAGDRWFDLKGRFLGVKRPTAKGTYYNNGKKVIVR